MKVACNYYAETEKLAKNGEIDIDYFKFPALGFQVNILDSGDFAEFEKFASRVTKIKPILLHGLYPNPQDLSSPEFINNFDSDKINRLINLTKTPGISIHPSLSNIDPAIPKKQLVRTIIDNINFLQEKYSGMDFISIENTDSRRFGALIKQKLFLK